MPSPPRRRKVNRPDPCRHAPPRVPHEDPLLTALPAPAAPRCFQHPLNLLLQIADRHPFRPKRRTGIQHHPVVVSHPDPVLARRPRNHPFNDAVGRLYPPGVDHQYVALRPPARQKPPPPASHNGHRRRPTTTPARRAPGDRRPRGPRAALSGSKPYLTDSMARSTPCLQKAWRPREKIPQPPAIRG